MARLQGRPNQASAKHGEPESPDLSCSKSCWKWGIFFFWKHWCPVSCKIVGGSLHLECLQNKLSQVQNSELFCTKRQEEGAGGEPEESPVFISGWFFLKKSSDWSMCGWHTLRTGTRCKSGSGIRLCVCPMSTWRMVGMPQASTARCMSAYESWTVCARVCSFVCK